MAQILEASEAAMFPFLSFLANGCNEDQDDHSTSYPFENLVGIGATFAVSFSRVKSDASVKVGTWYIASVPEGSTAFLAGLMPGDTMLQVGICEVPETSIFNRFEAGEWNTMRRIEFWRVLSSDYGAGGILMHNIVIITLRVTPWDRDRKHIC